ncbi:MAG TPA: galactokinase family protein, partial [Gemmatimonadaceae bacterium]|nr:galactokinase family protein [Gemmatimonadaceae bacterium]
RGEDVRAWWVPGRLEFLGKHTDYCGGPSLVCAVDRGFAAVSAPRSDARVLVIDAMSGERAEAELGDAIDVRQRHWSSYPFTVCRRVARNFPEARRGIDLAFASNLPPAAGLSSSSALIVATFLALSDENELAERADYRATIRTLEDLAGYLGAVENGSSFGVFAGDSGVGTQGGSQDHTAILCARAGALVQYAFAPIRFEGVVALPDELRFVIAASGVTAEKTGSALVLYNRAAAAAAAALEAWRAATGSVAPTLAAALADAPNGFERFRDVLRGREDLLRRVEQFDREALLVRAAGDALARGDLERLGGLVDQSQAGAEQLLGNQVPETIALARAARELGAAAASAFGAGFGGSVYALVRATEAEDFQRLWAERYGALFPARRAHATFFVTCAGAPAHALRPDDSIQCGVDPRAR